MKGVSVIIASTLIIVISITVVYMALQMGSPAIDRSNEILTMDNSKKTLVRIDNAVKTVLGEGEGSARSLSVSVSGGSYKIDTEADNVVFTMETFSQIVAAGVSKMEDGINVTAEPGRIYLTLNLDDFNVTGGGEFGDGSYNMIIRNDGYDVVNQKQLISIAV
ncbi:MAG: hypothetical protein V1818_00070 [Candidatus Aenigmatarchaeota archaeon]